MQTLLSCFKEYIRDISGFLKKDTIGPFILMVNLIVMLLSLFSLGTSEWYILIAVFLVCCSALYPVLQSWHQAQMSFIYILFGTLGAVYGCGIVLLSATGIVNIVGWTQMMVMIWSLALFAYTIAHIYLFLVQDGMKDIFADEINIKEIILWIIGIGLLWLWYYFWYLSMLSSMWWATVCFVLIRKGEYRMFALGALWCLLLTMGFLLLPNESNANIAATYCYYYLCVTVVYALFSKENLWN
jgi:hypothetical protein